MSKLRVVSESTTIIGLNNEIGLMFLVDQNQTLQNVIINIVTEHIQF